MTSVNAELYHREFDPVTKCPKCGTERADHDGVGVVYCDLCGYCTHASASGKPLRCEFCGEQIDSSEDDSNG
jgi:ribosomal protein L37AE/L43A